MFRNTVIVMSLMVCIAACGKSKTEEAPPAAETEAMAAKPAVSAEPAPPGDVPLDVTGKSAADMATEYGRPELMFPGDKNEACFQFPKASTKVVCFETKVTEINWDAVVAAGNVVSDTRTLVPAEKEMATPVGPAK